MTRSRILAGDALEKLGTLPDCSAQTCVTSPPYFGLRSYLPAAHPDKPRELGLEKTPELYVEKMVEVFREVRRVLRNDGTLWLNVADSFCASPKGSLNGQDNSRLTSTRTQPNSPVGIDKSRIRGVKPKDIIGVPWMLAFALRADGWYLRAPIIWAKPNGMPSSQKDRPTINYEFVFLLSKSAKYFYDWRAVTTPLAESSRARLRPDVDAQEGSHRAVGKTNGTMKAVKFGGTKYTPEVKAASRDERDAGSGGGGLRRLHERERETSPAGRTYSGKEWRGL